MLAVKERLSEKDIRRALSKLITRQPFFASILLRQELVVTERVNTMAVNGKQLFVNPVWAAKLDPVELMTVLAHEALHLTNKHNLRRGSRDQKLWNIAGDLAINKYLIDPPFKLPDALKTKGLYDEDDKYGKGASTEYIYAKLMKELDEMIQEQEDDQQDDESDDEQQGMTADGSDTNDDDQADSGDNSGDGSQGDSQESDNDSGEDMGDPSGEPSDGDAPKSARDKAMDAMQEKYGNDVGEVLDHPDLTEEDIQRLEQEINRETFKAMNIAKKRGKMPASIEADIRADCDPKVPWTSHMSRWMMDLCPSDYNWLYPNEVHMQHDIILPSMKAEAYGKIKVALDTSGSMSEEELRQAIREVFSVLQTYHENGQEDMTLSLIYFDSVVQQEVTIYHQNQVTKPVGRGGTDYSPVFTHIKEDIDPPLALIIITDGYCPVYSYDKPQCDVLWLLTDMTAKDFNPPFGIAVECGVEIEGL